MTVTNNLSNETPISNLQRSNINDDKKREIIFEMHLLEGLQSNQHLTKKAHVSASQH